MMCRPEHPPADGADLLSSAQPPAFNVSRGVAWAAGALVLVHVLRQLLPDGSDWAIVSHLGFQPIYFWHPGLGPALPELGLPWLTPITYQLLHADFMHLILNAGFLLAFGTAVERRIGSARFLVFMLLTGAAAAFGIVPGFIAAPAPTVLIGASGAVSGLFGALLHFAFQRAPGREGGLPPALLAGLVFIGINLLVGLFGWFGSGTVRVIAWEAHIAGMVAGYLLFPLFRASARQRGA